MSSGGSGAPIPASTFFRRNNLHGRYRVMYLRCMAKRARGKLFAMRVYTTEERKLRQLAAAAGFASPADYLRDHIANTAPKARAVDVFDSSATINPITATRAA